MIDGVWRCLGPRGRPWAALAGAVALAGVAGVLAVTVHAPAEPANPEWLPTYESGDNPPTLGEALTGPLVKDGHCLYANYAGQRVLLAFPPFAFWDERTDTLVMDPMRYGVGVETRGIVGNGVYDGASIQWRVKPGATCDTSHVFIVSWGEPPR